MVSRADLALVHTLKGSTDNQLSSKAEKLHQKGIRSLGAQVKADGLKIVAKVRVGVVCVECGGGMWRCNGVRILPLARAVISLLCVHRGR